MKWQKNLLNLLKERQKKKVALVVDTSTSPTNMMLTNNIVKLFTEMIPNTIFVEADFQVRSVTPITDLTTIKYFKHGKSSYTEALEWAEQENIDSLFYITDVTGYFYDELTVNYEIFWLVPEDFIPKVPFGKAIRVA
ncbi:VWA-like domain-containing protein [Bacillus sp. 2205SS5-2]|uniref:VWA-like domain-containing protein n=1 Tax=Bacillus sp. 2205SS5-2 TaxID=3109031 RepID=UPI003004B6BE